MLDWLAFFRIGKVLNMFFVCIYCEINKRLDGKNKRLKIFFYGMSVSEMELYQYHVMDHGIPYYQQKSKCKTATIILINTLLLYSRVNNIFYNIYNLAQPRRIIKLPIFFLSRIFIKNKYQISISCLLNKRVQFSYILKIYSINK